VHALLIISNYGAFPVLFELKWQGDRFTDEIAMIRNRGPHSGIAFLPSDSHAPWRQAFLHLHGPDEPPILRAFISEEVGSRLVSCDPVEIGASALKNVNGSDHRALLPGLSRQLYYPGQGEGTDIFMGVIPASLPRSRSFL
jgi:hypothetical protein